MITEKEWPNYLFFPDFSDFTNALKEIPLGVISEADALQIVAALTSDDHGEGRALWSPANGTGLWEIAGAEVVYNGLNSGRLPTRGNAKYVLGLLFPVTSVAPMGLIYMHYNESTAVAPGEGPVETDPLSQ